MPDTLYYSLIQNLSIQHKTSDRAERQFTQLLLSDRGQKKACRKKTRGEKCWQESTIELPRKELDGH